VRGFVECLEYIARHENNLLSLIQLTVEDADGTPLQMNNRLWVSVDGVFHFGEAWGQKVFVELRMKGD